MMTAQSGLALSRRIENSAARSAGSRQSAHDNTLKQVEKRLMCFLLYVSTDVALQNCTAASLLPGMKAKEAF